MKTDLDAGGHEALTQAILARTSGGACAPARNRLCGLVDGALDPFDRGLVDGHLAHCQACSALADALAEAAGVLPAFASLAPRRSVVGDVLSVTSLRRVEPTPGERVSAWLAKAAARPRFSLEVAYVLTVLLLVVLGNPVDAFREASAGVQPRLVVVAEAVNRPLAGMRAAGQAHLATVERAVRLGAESIGTRAAARAAIWQLWHEHVDAPVRAVLQRVHDWADRVLGELRAIFGGSLDEPAREAARSSSRQ